MARKPQVREQPWSEQLVRRMGATMRRARGSRSARTLSEQTEALGLRVSPEIIAKLDTGHRGAVLQVHELLVLAAAIGIPPALLLFDGYPDGVVEFLPGREAASKAAIEWFSGAGRIPTAPDGEPSPPNSGTTLVAMVNEYDSAIKRLVNVSEMQRAGDIPKGAAVSFYDQLAEDIKLLTAKIAELRSQLEGEN